MPPPIHQLSIKTAFQSLSHREKLYAHHMSRYIFRLFVSAPLSISCWSCYYCSAAWHGTRIILRQVSPESLGIYDLIQEIYASCAGDWDKLAEESGAPRVQIDAFLEYSATFLSNVGNYYVRHPIGQTKTKMFVLTYSSGLWWSKVCSRC